MRVFHNSSRLFIEPLLARVAVGASGKALIMNQHNSARPSTKPRRPRPVGALAALAAWSVLTSACGGAATPATTPAPANGPQSAIGRNMQIADATQARVNAQTVATALAGCAAQNADASNGGVGSCDATQLRAADPNVVPLLNLGARSGGIVYQAGAAGASTITAYAAIPGATSLRTYTMVRNATGNAQNSCAPADQVVCPNGAWPGG